MRSVSHFVRCLSISPHTCTIGLVSPGAIILLVFTQRMPPATRHPTPLCLCLRSRFSGHPFKSSHFCNLFCFFLLLIPHHLQTPPHPQNTTTPSLSRPTHSSLLLIHSHPHSTCQSLPQPPPSPPQSAFWTFGSRVIHFSTPNAVKT